VTIGISVYDMPAGEVLALATAADELGFDAIWLGEHVVLPVGYGSTHPTQGQHTEGPITGPIISPDTELLDPWVMLGAIAGSTQRLRLATGMYILPLRHPLLTARAACTLQDASRGRLLLGIGAGWLTEEFTALDVPFEHRGRRLEETVAILRAAWAGGPLEHRGDHFSFGPVQITSWPVDVPLIMGGNTPRALRRAALVGDGWFSSGTPDFEDAVRLRDRLIALRVAEGMTDSYRCYVRISAADPAIVQRYQAEGIDDVVVWADRVWPSTGTIESKREALAKTAAELGLLPG